MNIAVQTRRADEEAFADRRIPKGDDWLSREDLAALWTKVRAKLA